MSFPLAVTTLFGSGDAPMPSVSSMLAIGDLGAQVDRAFWVITGICLFFFVAITVLMVYFCIKYRKPPGTPAEGSVTHNTPLEVTWTIIPLILVIVMFYVGMQVYLKMRIAPENSYEVYVTAERWSWTFTHKNGANEGTLLVPAGRPIKLIMQSKDLLHSLYIPDLRVKQDVVPGRITTMWFEVPDEEQYYGKFFDIFCAEYCGKDHSKMLARLEVLSPEEFEIEIVKRANIWEEGKILAEIGAEKMYRYCQSCHTLDGTPSTGPSFLQTHQLLLAGETREFQDGSSQVVDDDYIMNSIMNPHAQIVKGFDTTKMTVFSGQKPFDDTRAFIAMLEFIKHLDKFDTKTLKLKPGVDKSDLTTVDAKPADETE